MNFSVFKFKSRSMYSHLYTPLTFTFLEKSSKTLLYMGYEYSRKTDSSSCHYSLRQIVHSEKKEKTTLKKVHNYDRNLVI